MNKLFNNFPIQVGKDRSIVRNETELLKCITAWNGKKTLYYTLYQCQIKINDKCLCPRQIKDWHFCNSDIDKLVFDNDTFNIKLMKKIHLDLLQSNIRHCILFSGNKGFHPYIFTQHGENLKNSKIALTNAHHYFIKRWGVDAENEFDTHIIGDIARPMRIPNTKNLESRLYCIPLKTQDLILGKEHILKKAKQQCFDFVYYGENYLDMKQFDTNKSNKPQLVTTKNSVINISVDKQKILDELPPCIQNMLLLPYIKWRQRYHILKYLLHAGYGESEIDVIMKSFLKGKQHPSKKHDNYDHYIEERQIEYVKRNSYLFSCDKVKNDGLCPVKGICKKMKDEPLYINFKE